MENKLKSQGKSIKASGDSNKQLVKANWKYEVSKDSRFQWNIHLLYQPNVCKSSMLPISPTFPKTAPFLGDGQVALVFATLGAHAAASSVGAGPP